MDINNALQQVISGDYKKRMRRKDKEAFRDFVLNYGRELGYTAEIEKGKVSKNIVIGNPDSASVLFCAHYDTPPQTPRNFVTHQIAYMLGISAVIIALIVLGLNFYFVDFITIALLTIGFLYILGFGKSNPNNANDNSSGVAAMLIIMDALKNSANKNKVAFVLFDNEEKGLLGSAEFISAHRTELAKKKIVSMDCIGNGDTLCIYPVNGVKAEKLKDFFTAKLPNGIEDVRINKSSHFKLSDYYNFKNYCAVGIAVEKKNAKGKTYLFDIHCRQDTFINMEYVNGIACGLMDYYGLNGACCSTNDKLAAVVENENKNTDELASEESIKTEILQ